MSTEPLHDDEYMALARQLHDSVKEGQTVEETAILLRLLAAPDRRALFEAGRATGTVEGWADYTATLDAARAAQDVAGREGETRLVTLKNARWLALLTSPSHDPKAQAENRALADDWWAALPQPVTPPPDALREAIEVIEAGLAFNEMLGDWTARGLMTWKDKPDDPRYKAFSAALDPFRYGQWLVRTTCCGRENETRAFNSREEAGTFRDRFLEGRADPVTAMGDPTEHRDRSAIIAHQPAAALRAQGVVQSPDPRVVEAFDLLGGMWSWHDDPAEPSYLYTSNTWFARAGRILREVVGRPALASPVDESRDPAGVI